MPQYLDHLKGSQESSGSEGPPTLLPTMVFLSLLTASSLLPAALAAVRHFDFTINNAVVAPDGFPRM
jgi:hypothetical protein